MTILEELYNGNISPVIRYIKEDSEYKKASRLLAEEIEKLSSKFTEEEKQICEKICDLYGDVCVIAERERYIDGFCTGARLILEITNYESKNFFS